MPDQADIHRKSISNAIEDRQEAAELLSTYFSSLPDKVEAWLDLHRLTQDGNSNVRWKAALALGIAFSQVPDKVQAWLDLHRLTQDGNSNVRWEAALALGATFIQIPDRVQALAGSSKLTQGGISDSRVDAAESMGIAFIKVPDKVQAWQSLHKLTKDKDERVRRRATGALRIAFDHIPDKVRAWNDLHKLTQDENERVRWEAARAVGTVFSHITDKVQAWNDLHKLTQDENESVRWEAALSLGAAFSQVPDKVRAWDDLHRLTQDQISDVRRRAALALGTAFGHIPNKFQAWDDLIKLTQDENKSVRWRATGVIGVAFNQIPDKSHAWQDLHKLTEDENDSVRRRAVLALGASFIKVPNKAQAWHDLHRLTQDENESVRWEVANALGAAFSQIPDKAQAWDDLTNLTQDKNSLVRMYAYHSLGRVSVFRATETDDIDTLEGYLKAAVTYFRKSSNEQDFGPASFCLPFYRTYMAIIFLEAKQEEIERYLAEAKGAVGGSESKDELLNAVENLARALQESQRLKDRPIQEIASELSAYRWYCDKAAEYMIAAEDKAPVAVKLLKKCNPIIGDRIQATIAEIQEKAKQICQITHGSGTEFETPGTEIDRAAKALSIEDIHRTQRCVTRITFQLKEFCRLLPEGKRELICGVIEEIELATEFPDKLDKIELGITYVSSAVETAVQLEEIRHEIHKVAGQILKRLNQNQMHTVQTVLNALEKKEYNDRQFQELADKLDAVVSELKRKHIEDPAMKNEVDEAYSYLKDPELNINDRIMITIPLIPLFLTYQGVIELQSGRNLLGAWNKLKSSLQLDNKIR